MDVADRIINPKTGQAVKYGSRVYKNLIKEGILEDNTLQVQKGAGRPKKKIEMEEYEDFEEPQVRFSRQVVHPPVSGRNIQYKQVKAPIANKQQKRVKQAVTSVEEDPYAKYTDAQLQQMIDNYLGQGAIDQESENDEMEMDESQWE